MTYRITAPKTFVKEVRSRVAQVPLLYDVETQRKRDDILLSTTVSVAFLGNDLPDDIFLSTWEWRSPISNIGCRNVLSMVDRATLTRFARSENPNVLTENCFWTCEFKMALNNRLRKAVGVYGLGPFSEISQYNMEVEPKMESVVGATPQALNNCIGAGISRFWKWKCRWGTNETYSTPAWRISLSSHSGHCHSTRVVDFPNKKKLFTFGEDDVEDDVEVESEDGGIVGDDAEAEALY